MRLFYCCPIIANWGKHFAFAFIASLHLYAGLWYRLVPRGNKLHMVTEHQVWNAATDCRSNLNKCEEDTR